MTETMGNSEVSKDLDSIRGDIDNSPPDQESTETESQSAQRSIPNTSNMASSKPDTNKTLDQHQNRQQGILQDPQNQAQPQFCIHLHNGHDDGIDGLSIQ